jgi:dynactin-3
LLSLDERIDRIDRLVFGQAEKDADYPKETSRIVDAVHSISTQINAATAGRSRIDAVFKRLGELEQFIDPTYVDQLLLSANAKADLILADEAVIRGQAELLENMESKTAVLNSEHIRAVPSLQNRLYDLCKVHLQQQDDADEVTEETKQLVTHYNNVISLLSKQFVLWDEMITRLEQTARQSLNVD